MKFIEIFLKLRRGIVRRIFIRYNRLKFQIMGISYGKNMVVYNKVFVNVEIRANVKIGHNFMMTSGWGVNPLCRNLKAMIHLEPEATLTIGDNTGMSSPCIWSKTSITIGNHVKVGGDCVIMDTDCHNLDWRIRRSNNKDEYNRSIDGATANSAPIVIDDDVLIGARCIILKGVSIGARSIIAAGSVVTKSIPADCIAGGNPARVIKQKK